jgi:chemotaxis protein CheZ
MSQHNDDNAQHDELLVRVGHMTRLLHDSLRGLGLDKLLERAAEDIPDARDRLDYVAKMSEQAAQRVLNATDIAIPIQESLADQAKDLGVALEGLNGHASLEQYQALALQMKSYLAEVNSGTKETKDHLMDIMMAQDFQDLTGQVIKKVTEVAQTLEQQLVQLLIDYSPNEVKRDKSGDGLLNGPQINPVGNDVVANQGQVDDLLDSLGF